MGKKDTGIRGMINVLVLLVNDIPLFQRNFPLSYVSDTTTLILGLGPKRIKSQGDKAGKPRGSS